MDGSGANAKRLILRSRPAGPDQSERGASDGVTMSPMTRAYTLAILIVAGSLAAVAAQQAQPKVVDVEKLADNLFVLKGGGGNTAVFVTAAGVTVVDTKIP